MTRGRIVFTLVAVVVALAGCGVPRVNLVTATTIGLKATPGDGQTRPPQVTIGYKRGELALVPTAGAGATADTDAQSALAAFHFSTRWFGHTELDSFIATGGAAIALGGASTYSEELAKVTMGVVPEAIQARREKLAGKAAGLTEEQAQKVLASAQYRTLENKNARESLDDYILRATSDALLTRLEAAFFQLP